MHILKALFVVNSTLSYVSGQALVVTADWYPLFVVADIPIEAINTVLHKATIEWKKHNQGEGDPLFQNRWVLIEAPNQTTFQKPSTGPLEHFQSEFIGATIEELVQFAEQNLGKREGAMGRGNASRLDHITNEIFGVLDTRTAEDGTLIFVSSDLISAEEEARMRWVWGNGSRRDEALLRYSNWSHEFPDATDADVAILARDVEQPLQNVILSDELGVPNQDAVLGLSNYSTTSEVSESEREKVGQWYDNVATNGREVWIGIRLPADDALWNIYGIFFRGGVDFLMYPENDFDETGAMQMTLEMAMAMEGH
ncbi:hypothetical protein EJ04DRAFT_579295 [Polyplosphaeria fusca]|uniref:Uncharacterized protein n=1 Tax=Polyplosphaeria fusca TaxID=682080 RepID=A0A9P4QUK3_9PLEO|nr:hypothetical protein EJ04DRAFT_579295 [Polyplosphaeria fusca]